MIVEDDQALQKQMQWAFDQYETIVATDRESAIAQLRRYEPAVVTMDLGLPPSPDDPTEGLRLLEEIHALAPDTKVVVLTGQNDRANAIRTIALGAHDFCTKPFEPEILTWTIERAFRVHELQQENRRLQAAQPSPGMSGIITRDPAMQQICRMIEKIGPSSATVLILGESGTGKELMAKALHELSTRREERFVAINCAAIPETLLESELFGYEKGAYTGAAKQTLGKIETASGGTLFLDEIGDLPMSLQAKLLRFLQERVIERVGGRQEIPVDVRIVCATHASLKDQIAAGKFREDLYYRVAEITVDIPPLRARKGDAALLSHGFVRRFAAEQRRGAMTLLADAIDAVESHPWPGNVRELENVIKRAVIMSETSTISAADLGLAPTGSESPALNLRQVRDEAEKSAVLRVLGRVNG
ncbi:MAG: PEP-CTERM-box response regulator transcription factor, partial [Betaproteobacteria bacterium]